MSALCKPMTRVIVLPLALLLLLAGTARTEDLTGRWGLGLEGGMHKLTEGYWDYSNVDQFGSLTLGRGLSPHWNIRASLKYGFIRPGAEYRGEDVGWDGKSGAPLYNTIWQPMATLQYRFAPGSSFSPWLGGGLGITSWKITDQRGVDSVGLFPGGDPVMGYDKNGERAELKGTDFTIGLELGLDLFLSEKWALNLGGRYHLTPGNELDNAGMSHYWGPDHVDANTAMVEGMFGLTYWFGGSDRDHDGVPNKIDKCPDQPEDMDGYNDLDGCPDIDNDKDGILDENDRCPNSAEDLDGFKDSDGCPDPDNDEDGIVDGRDECPDQPEDLDGFEDEDGCPDPDNDGDGVIDAQDQCPDTPAGMQVDEKGCQLVTAPETITPAVVAAPAALPQGRVLEGVNFASGSAELLPESIDVLLELAFTLQENPTRRIEVRGHTDATGDAALNLDLSQRRAQAVRDKLIEMGIDPGRVTAVGYGQEFPIADNGTREGRARNRRVEVFNLN